MCAFVQGFARSHPLPPHQKGPSPFACIAVCNARARVHARPWVCTPLALPLCASNAARATLCSPTPPLHVARSPATRLHRWCVPPACPRLAARKCTRACRVCACVCAPSVFVRVRVSALVDPSPNGPFTNPSARLRLRANLPEQAVLCPEPQVTAPFLVGALPACARSRSTSIAPTRKAEKHCCLEQQRTASFSTKRKTSLVTPAEPQRLEGTSLLDALTVPCHSLNWSRTDSSPRRHLPFLFHPPVTPPLPARAPRGLACGVRCIAAPVLFPARTGAVRLSYRRFFRVDSDLEAFNHKPTHGSFAAPSVRTTALPNM